MKFATRPLCARSTGYCWLWNYPRQLWRKHNFARGKWFRHYNDSLATVDGCESTTPRLQRLTEKGDSRK